MTYQDDPQPQPRNSFREDPVRTADEESAFWIAGIIAVCLVLALVVWGVSRSTSDTAMSPTTTTMTGSGAAPSPNR